MLNGLPSNSLADLSTFRGRSICHYLLVTLLYCLDVVFLAIICKRRITCGCMEDARLNFRPVDAFLFGVLTEQLYSYCIFGEFVGWSKISRMPIWSQVSRTQKASSEASFRLLCSI
jgi:hypothetical protein